MTKSPEEYNAAELAAGRLTWKQINGAIRWFQTANMLEPDGKAGTLTRQKLDFFQNVKTPEAREQELLAVKRVWPIRCLTNGRKPEITSTHYEENDDRSTHRGVDILLRHLTDDDPKAKRGDGFGTGTDPDGTVKWWIPPGTAAIASARGKVVLASLTPTGFRIWIDVGPCYDGYFHLKSITVKPGDIVLQGQTLGTISDNPLDIDAAHLHFENYVGDLDSYRNSKHLSLNPRPYLEHALFLSALSSGGS